MISCVQNFSFYIGVAKDLVVLPQNFGATPCKRKRLWPCKTSVHVQVNNIRSVSVTSG